MGGTKWRIGKLKGILLDLDDTLYTYKPCNESGKGATFLYLSRKLRRQPIDVRQAFKRAMSLVKRRIPQAAASHSRLLYLENCIELLTGKTNIPLALEAERIFWREYFREMRLRSGAKSFLARAKKRGLKIAIVSDLTAEIQMRKAVRLGIHKYIDFFVTSEESGRDKPAPGSYRLVLRKLNLQPQDVVMLGEDRLRDVFGAKRAGIFSVRIKGGRDAFQKVEKKFFGA